ncbi:MAG: HEAT repeat domain-containing protein [Akkermansiaceae bacterium]|nr:HEAT repeat domain-containing protein [Akkermansiaceae bacterium]
MITRLLFTVSLTTLSAFAQRGLKDIPDPDPVKQAAAFNLPEGMEIQLVASDPMIAKPVQMNFDSQGRIWLVSSGMYPHIVPGAEENDKVLILEDTNGNGVADKRTVFADDLHIPTAVLPADGGAYVANSTEIIFLKDTDGDGKADHRRVVLSGFGTEDTHHLVHTFEQGPDGMLYFLQSIYIHSHLETPYGVRRLMGGGVWHFRPETQRAEILSKGLINPWGFIFDEHGQTFATDGAGGQGINDIFPRSVFRTSPGAQRIVDGLNPGQPKLCGLEILSGSHIPDKLRGVLIAPDFRGHRINAYRLTPEGSSYKSTRIDDFLSSSHRAFRPIDVKMGPDGALYIADWYNPIIQHGEVDFRDERRDHSRGRIWRVTFKDRPLIEKKNFSESSIEDLVVHLLSKERVHREQARSELRTRNRGEVLAKLALWNNRLTGDFARMQFMWTYQALNHTPVDLIKSLIASDDPRYRAAALRVIYHRHEEVPGAAEIVKNAINDDNGRVRLWAVSCLAQIPGPDSVPTALQALDHPVDKTMDFALWSIVREHQEYWAPRFEAGKPVFGDKLPHLIFAMKALGKSLSLESIFTSVENGSLTPTERKDAISVISQVGSASDLSRLLKLAPKEPAILEQLVTAAQIRKLQPKSGKEQLLPFLDSDQPAIFASAAKLTGLWKFAPAREKLVAAFTQSTAKRQAAAEGLRLFGDQETIKLFVKLSRDSPDEAIRAIAVKELARIAPDRAAASAVTLLQKDTDGKDEHGLFSSFLQSTRASTSLAKALKDKTLPTKIATLGLQRAGTSGRPPKDLMAALQTAGNLKPMSQQLSAAEMAKLVDRVQKEGDPHRGETIYRRTDLQCTACHAIGGVGSPIGPDLVSIGASAPVDYLITSLLNPNDKIKEGYHTTLVSEKNGNAHTGGLVSESDTEVVLRDYAGKMNRIARADIKNITISPVSMMPPGLTAGLREDQFVDLVRFLSELGKDGDFKVSAKPIIRDWKVLQPHPRTVDGMGHYGTAVFAERFEGYQWQPYGSKVGGELVPSELPKVKGRGRNTWGVARFGITQKGKVKLKINDTTLLDLFAGKKEIDLPEKGPAIIELTGNEDPEHFTLAVNSAYRQTPVLLELVTE